QVNHIYHLVNNSTLSTRLNSADAITVLDELIAASDQYIGISDSTMPRGKGWNYMNLGKFTERCLLTVEYVHNFYRRINYSLKNEQD
ncbi:alpha-E domain-containing protein, partial [Pseudomonas aeruginosa]|uniref:alpha-E domain-containing protein n=1 Tax=Pseudomonas aeruginosa TaxID=287 RepID=UPI002B40E186